MPDKSTSHGRNGLSAMAARQLNGTASGRQALLDIFSVHYYPQGGEFCRRHVDGHATACATGPRDRCGTRATSIESWINDKVQLIPRLKQWVQHVLLSRHADRRSPSTTGARRATSTARPRRRTSTASSDARASTLATRWTTPAATTPTYKAMKLYRNYDGNKHGFGETSVSATVPNPDNLSAFAALRAADGALTVMVVNKVSSSSPVALNLAGFSGNGSAQAWQLTSSNAITRVADIAYSGAALSTTVPAQSVTLLVLPPSTTGTPNPPVASAIATPSSGVAPLAVSFDGSASTGQIAKYAWTFGDGATATGAKVSHSYAAAGSFTATLTVTDTVGATAATSKLITVTAPPPPPPPANACTITYAVTNDWGNGFQAAVSITNNTAKATSNWALAWTYAGNQHIYQIWNAVVSQSGKKVTVKNASWNPVIAAGATLSGIGFNATYSGSNPKPIAFTLNGQACAVR